MSIDDFSINYSLNDFFHTKWMLNSASDRFPFIEFFCFWVKNFHWEIKCRKYFFSSSQLCAHLFSMDYNSHIHMKKMDSSSQKIKRKISLTLPHHLSLLAYSLLEIYIFTFFHLIIFKLIFSIRENSSPSLIDSIYLTPLMCI